MFGEYTYHEYIRKITEFHGCAAPGIVLGGFLINYAREQLPKDGFFDVICETRACLPDAVQLLTPCSIGNGWLSILDLGKFACVFYDKYSGEGIRVSLDISKLESWQEIKAWFLKLKDKHEQDTELLFQQMLAAGTSIFCSQEVKVQSSYLIKKKIGKTAICPICKESYPVSQGAACSGCTSDMPYTIHNRQAE